MNLWKEVGYSGSFQAKLNMCESILTKAGLTKTINKRPCDNNEITSTCKGLEYPKIWEIHLRNGRWNILLEDYSYLYFTEILKKRKDARQYTYCYYASPYILPSLDEYLVGIYGPEFAGLGEIYYPEAIQAEYEQYVSEAELKQDPSLIRYDYNTDQYVEGRHPASHIHIGLANEIRIGAKYILNPVSFVYLVLRQCYPELWYKQVATSSDENEVENQIRKRLESVPQSYLGRLDRLELILS